LWQACSHDSAVLFSQVFFCLVALTLFRIKKLMCPLFPKQ
jgi:hypothetical protein